MWSNYIGYYTIQFSANYERTVKTEVLRAFLAEQVELREESPIHFVSRPGFLGAQVTLIYTPDGNWSIRPDTRFDEINLVEVLLTKYEGVVPASQIGLAIRIARFLGWKLLEEQNDAGEENVVIWRPNR